MTLDQGFNIAGAARRRPVAHPSVAPATDIDGDGFDDLIVGAPHADPFGRFNAGESYVIYGGNFTGVVTQLGTDADDVLISSGNPAEILVGGLGNDLLVANDARNCIGGAGDDVIVVDVLEGTPRQADGGNGVDTIQADNTFPLTDLTGELRDRFNSIEIFDLAGTVANRLILSQSSPTWFQWRHRANTLLSAIPGFVTPHPAGKGENV
jgi:Ca2+-binding RTX toxin-like protein